MSKLDTLKRIEQVREFKKDEAEIEVHKAWKALRTEQEALAVLERLLTDTTVGLERKKIGNIANTYELTIYYDYIDMLYRKIDEQVLVIKQKDEELSEKQLILVETYKELKTVGILKDKVVYEDNKRKTTIEQRQMDFAYLSRLPRE
ncbi:flagellar export protein FliJ [Candidatus Magnetominusculus dajiuhuensis]|uniref:flagellar export protein FliJ n=1 Tax=Candidatus Magnetominusculus dajiuhuensis TaxID=3137712 RepID=UPI003B428698